MWPRRGIRSPVTSAFTTPAGYIPALASKNPIRPTSPRFRRSRQPEPGRRSTYPPKNLFRQAEPSQTAFWMITGAINRTLFITYVETQLAPTLRPGDVVILDNLSSHKSEKAKVIFRQRGAWFLLPPPCSPDLNPIEMAFAKFKAHLRRIGAHTVEELWKAVGSICDLYPPSECRNYLRHVECAPD